MAWADMPIHMGGHALVKTHEGHAYPARAFVKRGVVVRVEAGRKGGCLCVSRVAAANGKWRATYSSLPRGRVVFGSAHEPPMRERRLLARACEAGISRSRGH